MNRILASKKMIIESMQKTGSYISSLFYYRVKSKLALNRGLGSIELIVLIMVLVGLALLFKDKISKFLADLTSQLNAKDIMDSTKN